MPADKTLRKTMQRWPTSPPDVPVALLSVAPHDPFTAMFDYSLSIGLSIPLLGERADCEATEARLRRPRPVRKKLLPRRNPRQF